MAQTSRPCDGCGTDVPRTKPTAPIPRYCSDDCKPRCAVADCGQPKRKRDWCASHYAQWLHTGREPEPFKWKWGQDAPRPYVPRAPRPPRLCSIEDCGKPHRGHGFCIKHETRFLRYGDPHVVHRIVLEGPGPCMVCGSSEREIGSHKFCSKRCERLFYTYDGNVPTERTCVQCGAVTQLHDLTRKGNRRKATGRLCDACQRASWRTECMTVQELAERDGTACSLCGEPVDMTLKRVVSLMCPSIDHIVPRSHGGGNEPENLALAHLHCNIRKSNRVA